MTTPLNNPELFIGLVGAVGTDWDKVIAALNVSLAEVAYDVEIISLSKLLDDVKLRKKLVQKPEDARIWSYMNAGNELRRSTNRGDALAVLAINAIRNIRFKKHNDRNKSLTNTAFIFKSLKHPSEVSRLRTVYGSSFQLISVYSPKNVRLDYLTNRIKRTYQGSTVNKYSTAKAAVLIERDESETDVIAYGQSLRDTFPKADVFIDATNPDSLARSIQRFIRLLFGDLRFTPTNDEFGMFVAHASARRSGSLARQVGAAITNADGDIIATGTNDVPRFGGGVQTANDSADYSSNITLGYDPSDIRRLALVRDFLQKLKSLKLLKRNDRDIDDLLNEIGPQLKNTQIMNITEYAREVHAEMAAITSAARSTVSVRQSSLFTTTFPCHNCAKHIVAADIPRVVYIEPYPKSQATDLYPEFISVDEYPANPCKVKFEPFVGMAPRRYLEFFTVGERKNPDGSFKIWNPKTAKPKYQTRDYIIREVQAINQLSKLIKGIRLK